MRPSPEKGAVLVIAMWILIILVLLAVSMGRRTSLELKLLRYNLGRVRALSLAQAALERVYLEKANDVQEPDTLNESWSNKLDGQNNPEFKDFAFGGGKFEIKYEYQASRDKQPQALYGMQDEQSKLNINKALTEGEADEERAEEINALLEIILDDSSQAQALTDKLIDWIDSDSLPRSRGKEDYSQKGVFPKNMPLDRMEEMLMIDGFTLDIYNTLLGYLTVYGDAAVNLNTAAKEVFMALGLSEQTSQDIVDYRLGLDEEAATRDDQAISSVSDLNAEPQKGAIFKGRTLSTGDSNKISQLISDSRVCVTSSLYKAQVYASANNVNRKITAVLQIKEGQAPKQLYRYEE